MTWRPGGLPYTRVRYRSLEWRRFQVRPLSIAGCLCNKVVHETFSQEGCQILPQKYVYLLSQVGYLLSSKTVLAFAINMQCTRHPRSHLFQ
jgi:hypothetical protein